MADKLETVNERNCGTKTIHVRVLDPMVRKTKKDCEVFTCKLISESGLYCTAEQMIFGDSPAARTRVSKALTTKWTAKSARSLSKLKLVRKKEAFHGGPHSCVLQLNNKAMTTKALDAPEANKLPDELEPPVGVQDVLDLSQDQAIDLHGFVSDVSPEAQFKGKNLVEATVCNEAGSSITLKFWEENVPRAEQLQKKEPIYIYGAYLVHPDSGGVYLSVRESTPFATPTGTRPKIAAMLAGGVRDLAGDQIQSLTVHEAKDYKVGPATSSNAAVLDALLQSKTTPPDTLFEIPAASFSLSDTETLLTKDGTRVWASVRMVDNTGSVEAKVTEKVALALTGCTDKAEFQADVEQGSVTWTRARVWATLRAPKSVDGDATSTDPRLIIVRADPRNFDAVAPLPAPHSDSRVVPTNARSISLSTTGKLTITIGSARFLASGALLLVEATKDPETVPREGGFAITNYIVDAAESDSDQKAVFHAVTACATKRLGRYALTKKDRALIVVAHFDAATSEFTVSDVWKLPPSITPDAFRAEIAAAGETLTSRLTRAKRKADPKAEDNFDEFLGPAVKRIHEAFGDPAAPAD
ncbi:unnamed protein product [Prorocentrum cordatum]|uniref:Replication protein A subunit n=1 Tax=Prorocentrum cordatum TaxID=2364126 RepID=A0ABN9W1K4_9DINO|nr:unnamed protein product [Polarella glacialis]